MKKQMRNIVRLVQNEMDICAYESLDHIEQKLKTDDQKKNKHIRHAKLLPVEKHNKIALSSKSKPQDFIED